MSTTSLADRSCQVDLETAERPDSIYLGEALETLLEAGSAAPLYAGTADPCSKILASKEQRSVG